MKKRFPKMRAGLLDQRNSCTIATPERIAKARDELKSSGSSANNDDAVEIAVRIGRRSQTVRWIIGHSPTLRPVTSL